MKRALILNNAYMQLDSYLYQSRRLAEELGALGVETDVRRNDFFAVAIDDAGHIDLRLDKYDFCVYLDKDKYVPYLLQAKGLRLFNSAESVEACDDKMTTFVRLAEAGIAVPYTLPGLLCFDNGAAIPEAVYADVEARLGYPMVVKSSFGSLGKGVYKVDDRAALCDVLSRLKCKPHLFQRYVGTSCGRDVRVLVIGGEVVAAMLRRSGGDFRSNIELGGTATPYRVPAALADECRRISELLGLDYCGVDFLFGPDGFVLCEVNSNAFFGGLERTTGVNVARCYAEYICRTVYGNM